MNDTHSISAESTSSEVAPSYDDVNVPVIVLVGFISAVVTFLTIALVQGMCYHWEASYLKKREAVAVPAITQIAEQRKSLQGGDGILPIDQAMEKVIEKFGTRK